MSALIVEPLYKKDFARFFPGNYWYVTPPSASPLDFAGGESFAYQVVFRSIETGVGWFDLFAKRGTGPLGGTNIGYRGQMLLANGRFRTVIKYDLSAPDETEVFTDGFDHNDGKVWNLIFNFDRSSGGGAYQFYSGPFGSIALDSEGVDADNIGETFENDGDFRITTAVSASQKHFDFFIVRMFKDLDLNNEDIIAALDADLTKPIDSYGVTGLVYSDGSTPGCVAEYFKERPAAGAYETIVDTSGNDLDLDSNGADEIYISWDDFILPKNRVELDPSFWQVQSSMPKVSAIQPKAARQGGIETTESTITQRNLNLKGHFYGITRAEYETLRNPLLAQLNKKFNSMRDPNLADAPYGFIIFDSLNAINDKYEFIPRPRKMTRMEFNLLCGDPAWHLEHHMTEPLTIDAAAGWTDDLIIDNTGNSVTYPRIKLLCDGSSSNMGPLTIENLSTGKTMYYAITGTEWVYAWATPAGTGGGDGKAINILCDITRVYWGDGVDSRIEYFSGEFFELQPGINVLRFTVNNVTGNGDLIVQVDWWEKNI